ncbi:MAG: AAA domain-containing protein, partial [Planctomycetes bacterium]|nr:AAA domain-containing protein [Planctomycetota bacterium]
MERNLEEVLTLKLNLVGESDNFRKVIDDTRKYSKCDAPVLILGETGTGKEMFARAVHYVGSATDKPFVAVNCGALPDSLIENELFGHVKGAYTDARHSQCGLVEQAQGGTLFLDEIEALSHKGQVALLRFLHDYEYRPLGSRQTRQARLRLITATNEPLERLIEQGVFRKDLFYRINILSLALPPLRERAGDIRLLAQHFVAKYREYYAQYDKYLDLDTLDWM